MRLNKKADAQCPEHITSSHHKSLKNGHGFIPHDPVSFDLAIVWDTMYIKVPKPDKTKPKLYITFAIFGIFVFPSLPGSIVTICVLLFVRSTTREIQPEINRLQLKYRGECHFNYFVTLLLNITHIRFWVNIHIITWSVKFCFSFPKYDYVFTSALQEVFVARRKWRLSCKFHLRDRRKQKYAYCVWCTSTETDE